MIEENKLVNISSDEITYHNYCQGCALIIRKEICKEFINAGEEVLPHDWQLTLLGGASGSAYYFSRPLFFYRIHGENTVGLNNNLTISDRLSSQIRLKAPKEALACVRFLLKYRKSDELVRQEKFLSDNLDYLKDKRTFRIFLQMLTDGKRYAKLKSRKGRILDLLYSVC